MDDLPGLFARDFGVKPQGKAAPMAPSPNPPGGRSFNSFPSSMAFGHVGKTDSMPVFDDEVRGGGAIDGLLFNDVVGGPNKYASLESRSPTEFASAFHCENPFNDLKAVKSSSIPLNDKPVFDEDIFNGIPGLKSSSASTTATYDDVFSSISTSSNKRQDSSSLDDLLENSETKDTGGKKADRVQEEKNLDFDDLIPGFGPNSWIPANRTVPESDQSQQSSIDTAAFSVMENPFAVPNLSSTPTVSSSGLSVDPSEEISKVSSSGGRKADYPSVPVELLDHLESLGNPEKLAPEMSEVWNDANHSRSGSMNDSQSSMEKSESDHQNKGPVDDFMNIYRFPSGSASASVGRSALPLHVNPSSNEVDRPATESGVKENFDASDDVWLTVSEIPLFTQPTSAPPPSRPPPPRPTRPNSSKSSYNPFASAADTVDEFSSFANSTQHFQNPRSMRASERSSTTSQMDELEDFALGRTQSTGYEYPDDSFGGDLDTNSASAAAAAMKEAMEKAEAKFRHAREMRGRENLKPARSKEGRQLESDDLLETERKEKQERLDRERQEKQKEEEEKEQRRQGKERRDQDEKEIEQIRFEKERVERDRALARQAVERATREARERAAAQARAKAEKAAVGKASAEARERAGRAAVQRVQAEARERAATEAKEKAAKAAAASKERENAEARARAERAAVERAAAEARARAAVGAREKAAAQARASSTANIVDDLSSIFGASPSPSGLFQEVEGESEERRRARLERDKRTKERAEKALAEKNERDLQAQREQAERHRNAETLDAQIKRWSAGKEGNLRALLSTLQYVLWPECGWQPVSLTDLITAASVKKVYRKATLCIHPDKVQQKGADIKQKYIAEKVFDLLKEAWNKLNSEELI